MLHTQSSRIFGVLLILVMLVTPMRATAKSPQVLPAPTAGEDPAAYDAKVYAAHLGISTEEAMRRFKLQDAAGALEADLREKEAATFAGLWLEHTPEFRVIVKFAGNTQKDITLTFRIKNWQRLWKWVQLVWL